MSSPPAHQRTPLPFLEPRPRKLVQTARSVEALGLWAPVAMLAQLDIVVWRAKTFSRASDPALDSSNPLRSTAVPAFLDVSALEILAVSFGRSTAGFPIDWDSTVARDTRDAPDALSKPTSETAPLQPPTPPCRRNKKMLTRPSQSSVAITWARVPFS